MSNRPDRDDDEIHYDPGTEYWQPDADASTQSTDVQIPAQELVDRETGEIIAASTYAQALALTEGIKGDLQAAAESFMSAGAKLAVFTKQQAWKALSRHSFGEYCELDLHIGESMASDLVRLHLLQVQFPDIAPRLLGIGISKARALLPHVRQNRKTGEFETPKDRVDELVTEAETKTWRDLRDHLNDDDGSGPNPQRERKQPTITCPCCAATITVSRATEVLSAKPARKH